MGEQKGIPGELMYEYVCQFTQVVEYGTSADAVLSGKTPPPAEGARLDVYFEGPITGPKVNGTVKGVDYLHIRADGRYGVAIPEPGSSVFKLRENVTLTTNHPEYSWVNPIQIWAPGTVDVAKGEIRIKGYAV